MTCKNCIHYDICIFHLTGNENKNCKQFITAADIAKETLEEIHNTLEKQIASYNNLLKSTIESSAVTIYRSSKKTLQDVRHYLDELKKKYEEEKE